MNKGGSCAASPTYLSKAFDCIVHDSLINKLEAYDFSYEVIQSYFIDRKHRHKINNFIDLFIGVLQGSILDPLLFKIYICDLFLFIEEEDITSRCYDTVFQQ